MSYAWLTSRTWQDGAWSTCPEVSGSGCALPSSPPPRSPTARALSAPASAQVLETSASGAPISAVATRLHLSDATGRNYLSAAIGKTGARNRTEAYTVTPEKGWI